MQLSDFEYLKELDIKERSRELNRLVRSNPRESLPKEIFGRDFYKPKPEPPTRPPEPTFVRSYEEPPKNRPTIDEIFKKNLPDSMYYSHYDLAKIYGHGYTPQEWRTYLRDHAMFIETELAAIAEAEARSALARLGNASGQEVQALKAILEKSKLINDAQKQSTKILLTFIPNSKEKEDQNDDSILREGSRAVHRHAERTDS